MRRTFTVRMGGITIGWSALERRDPDAVTARGALRPGPGYELVEPIFQLYVEARGDEPAQPADEGKLARHRAALSRLRLTLHAPNGAAIATSALHAWPGRSGSAEAIELEVTAADAAAWAALAKSG